MQFKSGLRNRCKTNRWSRSHEAMLVNLNEFNYLRKQYILKMIPNPSLKASLDAAQFLVQHDLTSKENPENPRSAIYLARTIAKQADYIVCKKQRGNVSNHKSLINNSKIQCALITWSASHTPGEVSFDFPFFFFSQFQAEQCVHFLTFIGHSGDIPTICCRITAASVWNHKKCCPKYYNSMNGFTPQVYKNSLYFKGHEQPDVVICQKKYIKNYRQYQSRSCIYGGDNLDIAPEVNPETLGDNKNTCMHKKSLDWHGSFLNAGRVIHISDVILETTGCLKLSPDVFAQSQSESGKKPESDDAATIICPGTTGNKWWDIDQLCNQVAHKAIPIFETLHSNLQAVFVFDCSLAHRAFAKSALRVQNMNLNPGGKQSILRDTVIPKDNPHIPFHLFGQLQKFVFDDSHPLHPGKAKGVRAILKERGLWDYYTQKAWQEGQPLNLQCKDCLTTNIKKDIVRKAEELIAQVKANGYSLSEDQLVKEVLPTSQLPQETEINPTPVTDQHIGKKAIDTRNWLIVRFYLIRSGKLAPSKPYKSISVESIDRSQSTSKATVVLRGKY
ncbi:hypothetical protein MJO28_017377 [Puccinia striiformis f. sp. tritici]|nr:hypothetical protein MJO28_017377 [Puccinia striiformis f. sp. tritici]